MPPCESLARKGLFNILNTSHHLIYELVVFWLTVSVDQCSQLGVQLATAWRLTDFTAWGRGDTTGI